MMVTRRLLIALFVSMFVAACASRAIGPVPNAENPDSAGIGLAVELRAPLGWPTYFAQTAYFARVDGTAVPHSTEVIASNYARDGRIYLLNVPPGDYAVVAVDFTVQVLNDPPSFYTTYLDRNLMELTRVSVAKGKFSFAGRYLVDMSSNVCEGEADDIQLHYVEVISPGSARCGLLRQLSRALGSSRATVIGKRAYLVGGPGHYHYRGSVLEAKRDDAERQRFLDQATSDLLEGKWSGWFK
jgi:hypothetical protein